MVLRDSTGNRYLYGLDLISVSDSANKKFYYHTDGLTSLLQIPLLANLINQLLDRSTFPGMRGMVSSDDVGATPTGLVMNTQLLRDLCADVASQLDNVFGPIATKG